MYFEVQAGTKSKLFLVVYVYEVVLFLASCTLVYKHAPKQAYFSCLCLWDGAFTRILHFGVQTGTKTNLFFSCLCFRGCAFTRILYFDVQTSTKTNLFLVVYVYGIVPLLASCTSMYKQAPKQAYFSCLCLWDGAFSRIFHFGVQTGTKTNLFIVVYV